MQFLAGTPSRLDGLAAPQKDDQSQVVKLGRLRILSNYPGIAVCFSAYVLPFRTARKNLSRVFPWGGSPGKDRFLRSLRCENEQRQSHVSVRAPLPEVRNLHFRENIWGFLEAPGPRLCPRWHRPKRRTFVWQIQSMRGRLRNELWKQNLRKDKRFRVNRNEGSSPLFTFPEGASRCEVKSYDPACHLALLQRPNSSFVCLRT